MLRVATLNIWNFFGPWEERKGALLAAIRHLDADIVGLQEVACTADLDHVKWLQAELGMNIAWGLAEGVVGNAVLTKHPIVEQDTRALPNGGTLEGRCIVHAKVRTPQGIVPFFSTHLNYKLDEGHVRVEQVRACAAYVAEKSDGCDFPGVLVGDFNANPESDEIRYLRGLTGLGGKCVYFVDAFGVSGEGPGETWSKLNPFTVAWMEPDRRIDYVFVQHPKKNSVGYVHSARLWANTRKEGEMFPTDHFGVVAELTA